MTVCIAAICEKDKEPKIVVAGDRMVTYGDIEEFEQKEPKLIDISPNCVIAAAGNATTPSTILYNAKLSKTTDIVNVRKIGNDLLNSYFLTRSSEIENIIFKKYGINTYKEFLETQKTLRDDWFLKIEEEFDEYQFEVQLFISGIDENGPQLYKIEEGEEKLEPLDALGYITIGIGADHARKIFFSSEYSDKCSLNEALYTVYKAKKIAEHAPGVGPKYTDLWIVTKSKTVKLDYDIIDLLQEMYDREQRAAKRSIKFKMLDELISKFKL